MASVRAVQAQPATPFQRFSLTRATSVAELQIAAALRQRIFQERRGLNFDEALEARRDRRGHVFLLFNQRTPVAVGRVLPYPSRLSPLLDLSRVPGGFGADSEIGRIACVASEQTLACALLLLTLGSLWLLEHTRLRRYVGHCHPKLVDSYRRLGAVPGAEIRVPGRSEAHRVVSGEYQQAAELGARVLGFADRVPGARP